MHTRTGNFRKHKGFHSHHLADDREIIVYLPPCYFVDENRRCPVLYLRNGQNVFDEEKAFGGREWRAEKPSIDAPDRANPAIAGSSLCGLHENVRLRPDLLARTEAGGAGHNEEAWAARPGQTLEFLFAPRVPSGEHCG